MNNPTFNDRRRQARNLTALAMQKARTADRVARDRARKVRIAKPNWANLTEQERGDVISEVESVLMENRKATGNDADSKMAEAIYQESLAIAAIDLEEKEQKMKNLGEDEMEDKGDVEDEGYGHITETFTKNMTPMIERWEAKIIAEGQGLVPGVSQKELDDFAKTASNKAGVRAYLEGITAGGDDDDKEEGEGEDKEEEDEEDEDEDDDIERDGIEVVVTDDEEEVDEDEEMADFIVQG